MFLAQDWFRDWFNSPYYYLLYADRDEKEAEAFIGRLLDYLQPAAGSTLLDVACGLGRHAKILAAKGYDVTGIDLAPNSIAKALESANDHLHFYEHDMRELFWINYFQYVFNFFTSFGYFDTDRENSNAIRTMVQALQKNGTLVMDYLNGTYADQHLIADSEKTIDGVRFVINKHCDDKHFYKKITIEDPAQPGSIQFTERVARLSLQQFTELFSRHGLEMQAVFGDYELNAYDEQESARLIMVAKKINY